MVKAPTPYLTDVFHIAAAYVFPIIGILCVLEPYIMTDYAPGILGTIMFIGGGYSYMEALRDKVHMRMENIDLVNALVMIIIGIIVLAKQDNAIELMGYAWGMLGISKGSKLFHESISLAILHDFYFFRFFWGLANIGLGIFLLIDPNESFAHHVIVLGFELIAYSAMQLNLPNHINNLWVRLKLIVPRI